MNAYSCPGSPDLFLPLNVALPGYIAGVEENRGGRVSQDQGQTILKTPVERGSWKEDKTAHNHNQPFTSETHTSLSIFSLLLFFFAYGFNPN